MKKILLIPTVLTIVSVPAISLAACSSLQDPEPSYDPYVTDEEMLSAITLLNDEYVQLQGELFKNGNRTDIINKCSPSISYELEKTESKYRENFIVKNYDSATSISRNSIDSEWSISETVCDKFLMPQDLSENYLLESYLIAYTYEKEFEFDNNKKCYTISVHDLSLDYGANLYFYDKKLIKLEFSYFNGTSQWVGSFNLSYDKNPLQLPHNPKLNDEQLATEMKEAIELSGIKIAQVHYEEHILEETSIVDYEYSPFIYHMMGTKGETSPNLYVVNNDDTSYTKIFPSPEDPTQWTKQPAEDEDFKNIESLSSSLVDMYNASLSEGGSYQYNNLNECYWIQTSVGVYSWYFDNRQLIKVHFQSLDIPWNELNMIFEHDMAMPELPLPVEIKSQGFFVEEGEVISTLSREWHKIAYYKLSIDEFHADGSDIACFGVWDSSIMDIPVKLNVDVANVLVDEQPVDFEYDSWTIKIPNQSQGNHKIEILVKFNANYDSVKFSIKNGI